MGEDWTSTVSYRRENERYIETNKEIQIFKSEVLLHRSKKTGNLPWQEFLNQLGDN
jgi:hypothetical protein